MGGAIQLLMAVVSLFVAWVIISIFNLAMRFWLWSDTWQATCFLTSLLMYYQGTNHIRESMRGK